MSSDVTGHRAIPADGFVARWATEPGGDHETVTLRWDNEGWTIAGRVETHAVEYVLRLTAQWHVSQFLLFRDLPEADLWLGTDGHGRWGEVNGGHRTDLDGATDIALDCTPFPHTVPIRRLPLPVGHAAEVQVLYVDVETLGVVPEPVRYTRVGERRWRHERGDASTQFDIDEFGIPLDVPGSFRRML